MHRRDTPCHSENTSGSPSIGVNIPPCLGGSRYPYRAPWGSQRGHRLSSIPGRVLIPLPNLLFQARFVLCLSLSKLIFEACWIEGDEKSDAFQEFRRIKQKFLAQDKRGQLVFLADSAFSLQMAQDQYKELQFYFTSEF